MQHAGPPSDRSPPLVHAAPAAPAGRNGGNGMRKLVAVFVFAALAVAASAFAEEWQNVPLIDHHCLNKVKGDPDSHPTSCLKMCAKSGYGILTADGKWLKFDKAGNEKALAALDATDKKDHIRVNVTGDLSGGMIKVTALTIQ